MNHKPIFINNIALSIDNHTLFENFSTQINWGKRIIIVGANGTGKSTLLKIIRGIEKPSEGSINFPPEIIFGYVPQTVVDYPTLSGGQRFNKALSAALSLHPDVMCLDEPTNHLDSHNKKGLVRMLQRFAGTLIIVSHDTEILTQDFDEIWHLEHDTINVFSGNYSEYLKHLAIKKEFIATQRELLQKEKRALKKQVQQEQKRVAQSRSANIHEKDRTLLGAMKESGSRSTGKINKRLSKAQEDVSHKLSNIFIHKKIEPKFNVNAKYLSSAKSIVSISHGSCGYEKPLLNNIDLQVKSQEKIAIIGDNGTGKSTFLKALLHDPRITLHGEWYMPKVSEVGYLDQHYSTLNPMLTVTEVIQEAALNWANQEVREHLNDFLFCTPQEVTKKVSHLSGGEKARLSLAQIAAKSPYLLLLDEVTNNIDQETREHIIEVFEAYPGAMIIVTHDTDFLARLSISTVYETKNGTLVFAKQTY